MAVSLVLARIRKQAWGFPSLRFVWLVIIAFIPQLLTVYLPATRRLIPDVWVSVGLLVSQIFLLIFCWLNRRLSGMWLLALGLGLNFLVIAVNGGFMPISPQTAGHLVSQSILQTYPLGSRFGFGKDVLLLAENTRLGWLSDRFLLPDGFPYRVAFSLGDILVSLGAFWLMVSQGKQLRSLLERKEKVDEQCKQKRSTPLYL
ncbi:MAG TPA: DUF5317 domain-containing protein [Anaerolineales bacterium]|nr:DUF5317 domain-containing protein [Anaerolineales bacterium]